MKNIYATRTHSFRGSPSNNERIYAERTAPLPICPHRKTVQKKIALIDRGVGRKFTYNRTLTASLLLADKLKRINDPLIGVMLPTSAGAALLYLPYSLAGRLLSS